MQGYKNISLIPGELLKTGVVLQCSSSHQFFVLPDASTAEEFIIDHCSSTQYYSEVGVAIGEFVRPIKLFIDFDWAPDGKTYSSSHDIFTNILLPALLEFMHTNGRLSSVNASDFVLFPMDAIDKSKISFHCVLDDGHFFRSMVDHRLFMMNFCKYVKQIYPDDAHLNKYVECIDFQRYSMNPKVKYGTDQRGVFFQLRAPLCSKGGRKKKIPDGHTFKQCLVLRYDNTPAPLYIEGLNQTPDIIKSTSSAIHYNSKNEFFWVPGNMDEAVGLLEKVCPYDHSCIEISRRPFNGKGIMEFRRTNAATSSTRKSVV